MVPLKCHTEYTPNIMTKLDTGATCSAMSCTDLLNILQNGEGKGENKIVRWVLVIVIWILHLYIKLEQWPERHVALLNLGKST